MDRGEVRRGADGADRADGGFGAVHGGHLRAAHPADRGRLGAVAGKVGRFVVEVLELLVLDEPQVLQRLSPHPAFPLLSRLATACPVSRAGRRTEQGGPDAHHRSAFLYGNLVIDGHSHRQFDQRRSGRSQAARACPGAGRSRAARPRDRGRRGQRHEAAQPQTRQSEDLVDEPRQVPGGHSLAPPGEVDLDQRAERAPAGRGPRADRLSASPGSAECTTSACRATAAAVPRWSLPKKCHVAGTWAAFSASSTA